MSIEKRLATSFAFHAFAVASALASLGLFSIVFINETFFGHGVLFIEPNIPLAFTELITTILALFANAFLFMRRWFK